MHRVYVAQDTTEALGFLRLLENHDIRGRIIEDRDFPERGELHDVEHVAEVWIAEDGDVTRAQELALQFDDARLHPKDPRPTDG